MHSCVALCVVPERSTESRVESSLWDRLKEDVLEVQLCMVLPGWQWYTPIGKASIELDNSLMVEICTVGCCRSRGVTQRHLCNNAKLVLVAEDLEVVDGNSCARRAFRCCGTCTRLPWKHGVVSCLLCPHMGKLLYRDITMRISY